ncbi:hypothetical protein BDW74DRAFT_172804 [Aspergillus multicolor]|uniref:uncharacterized protein n=1 Tax=Aspergillus multicolor TaxID=41759 RepID=UPI003CCCF499
MAHCPTCINSNSNSNTGNDIDIDIDIDVDPIPPNVPQEAVIPIYLGKHARQARSEHFTFVDTNILLSDFGEAFAPLNDQQRRLAKDCHTPLAYRPPEARFEPKSSLTYPADICSLALAIWETLGMQVLFSAEWVMQDEMTCQHLDALGADSMPESWWNDWTVWSKYFDEDRGPKEGREVFPSRSRWMVKWVMPELERRWLWGDKEVDTLSDWSLLRNLRSIA